MKRGFPQGNPFFVACHRDSHRQMRGSPPATVPPMISSTRIRAASRAALVHLGLSALVGLATAAIVFGLWFPFPYRNLAGGQHLFLVLVGVDVVCGPLLTAILFNPLKSR